MCVVPYIINSIKHIKIAAIENKLSVIQKKKICNTWRKFIKTLSSINIDEIKSLLSKPVKTYNNSGGK